MKVILIDELQGELRFNMPYAEKLPKVKEQKTYAVENEKIIVINGKTYFFWKDFFHNKKIRFHQIPSNTVIPIRNANAPLFDGNMEEAIAYVKKEEG
jgi:hypothetical protein